MSYQKIAKVSLTCGSCRYLQTDKLDKEPCNAKGKIASSATCTQHAPDVFPLVRSAGHVQNQLLKLADIATHSTPKQLETIAAMLLRARPLKRLGFSFYQKVYVRVQGSPRADYISNFAVAHVLDADREFVRLVGESGTTFMVMNEKESNTFFTVSRFQELREQMLTERRFVDPDTKVVVSKSSSLGKIRNIDSLDDIGAVDYDRKGSQKIVKTRKESDDLVSFVRRLQAGHIKATKSRVRQEESVKL